MRPRRVAILTRAAYRSPRFLAEGQGRMLGRLGVQADLHLQGVGWLVRASQGRGGRRQRMETWVARQCIQSLHDYDLFVVADSLHPPHDDVDLSALRSHGKPVLMYEVFYAGGAKHWLERLPRRVLDKFDGYLCVSGIHGCAPVGSRPIDVIGMDIQPCHPLPRRREREFSVLVDFPREGHEAQRNDQMEALRRLGIRPVVLQGEYSFREIERVYRTVSAAFVAFPEAFGLPVAQLQSYCAVILSPDKGWVMGHALLPTGSVFFETADAPFNPNFRFYGDVDDLRQCLLQLRRDSVPAEVTSRFLQSQPAYSQGDLHALWQALRR
jgi:hypothetical protein